MKALLEPCEGNYTEKKSKFIAYIAPVADEAEALAIIEQKKKQYHDARHNCSAYICKTPDAADGKPLSRFSDDGEPSGTAGKPILDVLEGAELTGVVCVVTRYFGGVLLGTGGLVRAYSTATKDALEGAKTSDILRGYDCKITCSYNDLGKVEYIVRESGFPLIDTIYEADVVMKVIVPLDARDALQKKISEATAAQAKIEFDDVVDWVGE